VLESRVSRDLSHTAVRIEVVRNNQDQVVTAAKATGFLWQNGEELLLITNVHNVAGWDYLRDKAMSDSGALPTHVRIEVEFSKDEGDNRILITRRTLQAPILDTEGQPAWLVHPLHGPVVDVAALPLKTIDVERLYPDLYGAGFAVGTRAVNVLSSFSDFDIDAGDDAYVIGFPLGLDGGGNFPIWKRASVASEPGLQIGGLPKTLIDTATRPGMSGSPVIAVRRGLIRARGSVPGQFNAKDMIGQAEAFLGVYSGRVDDDPLGAHIGIVWKAHVVDEIVQGNTFGKLPWDR
jgi:hypothetical protein